MAILILSCFTSFCFDGCHWVDVYFDNHYGVFFFNVYKAKDAKDAAFNPLFYFGQVLNKWYWAIIITTTKL